MACDPVALVLVVLLPQLGFPLHSVGRRRPQRLQRTLILLSIAKNSPFNFPRRLTDCNDDRFLVEQKEEDGPTLRAG